MSKPYGQMSEKERETERRRQRRYYRKHRRELLKQRRMTRSPEKMGKAKSLKEFWEAIPFAVRRKIASLKARLAKHSEAGKDRIRKMMQECWVNPPQTPEEFDARYGHWEEELTKKVEVEEIRRKTPLFELPK